MQKNLVYKIAVVRIVQFKSFIDFQLSTNGLVDNPAYIISLPPLCYLILSTGTSELDKIHPMTYLLGISNLTYDSSG